MVSRSIAHIRLIAVVADLNFVSGFFGYCVGRKVTNLFFGKPKRRLESLSAVNKILHVCEELSRSELICRARIPVALSGLAVDESDPFCIGRHKRVREYVSKIIFDTFEKLE